MPTFILLKRLQYLGWPLFPYFFLMCSYRTIYLLHTKYLMDKLGVVPGGDEDNGHVVGRDELSQQEQQRRRLICAPAGEKSKAKIKTRKEKIETRVERGRGRGKESALKTFNSV